jgi:hypothetical protein
VPSTASLRYLALLAALMTFAIGGAQAQDLDALFLGGYWCNSRTSAKSENIPRNRIFLLTRRIDGTPEEAATERLIDIVGDVRGQRIILSQILKNKDGTDCKTDCTVAQRLVHKDMLEAGDWNSNTGVFKSNSPREYVYRCDR